MTAPMDQRAEHGDAIDEAPDSTGSKVTRVLGTVSLIGMALVIPLGLVWTPADRRQGDAVRLLYVHVPSAWLMYLSVIAVVVGGVMYLWKGSQFWDLVGEAGAEVGVLAYGATARPAKGAVLRARDEGHQVSFCRPVTIWPFPISKIQEACRGLRQLLVPEMNLGQLAREVERFVDCEVVPLSKIGGVVHTLSLIHI